MSGKSVGHTSNADDEMDAVVQTTVPVATSYSLQPSEERVMEYPATPWEIVAYAESTHPEHRQAMITFSQLPRDVLIDFCGAFRRFTHSDAEHLEIRPDLTFEMVSRERTPDPHYVFSQEFMTGVHRAINAKVTYTDNGLVYTNGERVARVYRGNPVDQDSADNLARWVTKSENPKRFLCWPEQNAILGQFVRIWRPEINLGVMTFRHDTDYDRESKLYPEFENVVSTFLKQRGKKDKMCFTDPVRAYHEIQFCLWQHRATLGKKLMALAIKQQQKYDQQFVKPGSAPAFRIPTSLAEIRAVDNQQAGNRGSRNRGLQGKLFHHMSDQAAATAEDASKCAILRLAYEVAGSAGASYELSTHQHVLMTQMGCLVEVHGPDRECDHLVTLGSNSAGSNSSKRLIAALYSAASNKAIRRVTAHFSIIDIADDLGLPTNCAAFAPWKIAAVNKRSSFHTPDFLMTFERRDEPDARAYIEVITRGGMVAMAACAGEATMQRLYAHGLVATTFEFAPYQMVVLAGNRPIPPVCGRWNLEWLPFSINHCATVLNQEEVRYDESILND